MENRYFSQADKAHIAKAPLNYRRGVFFLNLAIEQVRTFDPGTAEALKMQYLFPLNSNLEKLLERIPWEDMGPEARFEARVLENTGANELEKLSEEDDLPRVPPGFGLGELGLKEADRGDQPFGAGGEGSSVYPQTSFRQSNSSLARLTAGLSGINANYAPRNWGSEFSSTGADSNVDFSTPAIPAKRNATDFGPIGSSKPSDVLASRMAREVRSGSGPTLPTLDVDAPLPLYALPSPISQAPQKPPPNLPTGRLSRRRVVPLDFHDAVAAYFKQNCEEAHPSQPTRELRSDRDFTLPLSASTRSSRFSSYQVSPTHPVHSTETQSPITPDYAGTGTPQRDSGVPSADGGVTLASHDPSGFGQGVEDFAEASLLQSPAKSRFAPTPSWAKIAAIPTDAKGGLSNSAKPHITLTLASPAQGARLPVATATTKTPTEPLSEQYRVVWLAHLPAWFVIRDVSAKIVEGPVMSILMQENAHATLPGKSACIIFMSAEHALQFLANNNYSIEKKKQIGPTRYAKDVTAVAQKAAAAQGATEDESAINQGTGAAEDVTVIQGGAYAATDAITRMGHPTYARRRVKWSRSRLFYDVSLRQFKRDVYSLVGSPTNVELFHFYNPGEATAVFSSVDVAEVCVKQFERWRHEKRPANVTTLDEEGRPGGATGEGRLDGKKGRYRDVEVGFVRDFNESPPEALFSQYGRDGRLRSTSRAEGCEGLYEGPAV